MKGWGGTGVMSWDWSGTNWPRLRTSWRRGGSRLRFAQIRAGTESVIVVAKDQPYYNRYGDQAKVKNLIVDLDSALPAGASVYQLNLPHVEQLPIKSEHGRPSVKLEPFALTALLLVTHNPNRIEKVRQQIERDLPRVVGYAVDVLMDEQVKTEVTAAHLPP